MGGFFGITANYDCVQDVFFGVDYHSHLGKARAGMAAVNEAIKRVDDTNSAEMEKLTGSVGMPGLF